MSDLRESGSIEQDADKVYLLHREEYYQTKDASIPPEVKNAVLVAPDAGAIKKVLKVAQVTGLPMVRADKIRDVNTGAITETVVYSDHIKDKSFLIVDDICDGGRTFIELEKVLRPLTDAYVYLYVTHGIFSKGLEPLGCFNKVYTAFPFPGVDTNDPILEVI